MRKMSIAGKRGLDIGGREFPVYSGNDDEFVARCLNSTRLPHHDMSRVHCNDGFVRTQATRYRNDVGQGPACDVVDRSVERVPQAGLDPGRCLGRIGVFPVGCLLDGVGLRQDARMSGCAPSL